MPIGLIGCQISDLSLGCWLCWCPIMFENNDIESALKLISEIEIRMSKCNISIALFSNMDPETQDWGSVRVKRISHNNMLGNSVEYRYFLKQFWICDLYDCYRLYHRFHSHTRTRSKLLFMLIYTMTSLFWCNLK